ncbi:MAG TPA: ion transporter, partial [Ferruginibacter sp.]|nr:ion transporter [Ferruginibacter sp.]
MYSLIKSKVHALLHPEIGNTRLVKLINIFIIILIILNVIAVTLETVSSIYELNKEFFRLFDLVSVIIFSIEYVFRVWSCNHDPRFRHSVHGRLRYIFSIE